MPTPYASVGGVDADLSQHASDVRRGRLGLVPTAEGVAFSLDVDASGALLGVTSPEGGEPTAVPGFWAGAVTTVVCRDLLPDPEDFWRSRLVADVAGTDGADGAEPVRLVTGLVDLAHAGPGAYRRGRATRVRLALTAERVRTGGDDGRPALSCPPEQATAEVTGVVRAAGRRTSGRTGHPFTVLTVETAAGLALDVCAAPEVLADLPAAGSTVTAAGRLTAVFAGAIGELAPELSPDVEPPLVVSARPAVVPRAPVPLYVPGDLPDWPATTPLLELATTPQVLAPLVHTAGATDAGVIACCVDWDGRWQLRRFPPGAVVPDAVVDLAGPPHQCVVHRGGVAVVVGRELLVLDAALRLHHRAAFPEAALHVVASPSTVHVLATEAAGPADAPDDPGRRAAAQGATVHRYRLHRLELGRLGDPTTNPWQKTDLPVSGVYAPMPTEVPGWVEPTPADTRGEGFWFAVPGRDAWDRPAQHHLTVTAEGSLALQTETTGPPWTTARLRHGELLLTGDSAGPAVDGVRAPRPGPVASRLLAAPTPDGVPAAVATRLDGQGTVLAELRSDTWTQVAAAPGSVLVTSATDARTGARWYGLSGHEHPGVLGMVTGERVLRPVLQAREPFALVSVADDAAVLTASTPGTPVLDLRDGRLVPAGRPTAAQRPLSSLVQVGTAW